MEKQEISLKWNGYQNNILLNLKELFKDEGLSDVTLVSEGCSFKAHKVILSANSLLFKTIFQQNPHKDPIIVLHDINTDSLRTLLTFMYYGEVNVTEEFLPVLLKTAEILKICGLSTGNETVRENEKTTTSCMQTQTKKRKKAEVDKEDITKIKKPVLSPPQVKVTATSALINGDSNKEMTIIPKEEPLDSPLTDYSGENTNDTDISVLDNALEKKYPAISECLFNKPVHTTSGNELKKWLSEVNNSQPSNNIVIEKGSDLDDEKDMEIDKEVETVLQSGTLVESLSITTENLNCVSSEMQIKDKNTTCYASPSFPCPFCPRIYNSWGYRRRHVKSRHFTNRLSCKWCVTILSSTAAWYSHATRAHGVPHEEARNSLVVMVEAHAVLTLKEPSVSQLLGQVGITDSNVKTVSEKIN